MSNLKSFLCFLFCNTNCTSSSAAINGEIVRHVFPFLCISTIFLLSVAIEFFNSWVWINVIFPILLQFRRIQKKLLSHFLLFNVHISCLLNVLCETQTCSTSINTKFSNSFYILHWRVQLKEFHIMGTETESSDSSLILIKQGAEAVSLIHTHWIFRINLAHAHYVKKSIFSCFFMHPSC